MSIYCELLKHARAGGKYKIDLKNKSLKIGKIYYIKNGTVLIDDKLISAEDLASDEIRYDYISAKENPWDLVSQLYQDYKHSIQNSYYKDNSYFKALKYEELTKCELVYNLSRHFAQALLEGYILLASMQGWLKWQNDKHWFWQDKNDKDFIILKEYV